MKKVWFVLAAGMVLLACACPLPSLVSTVPPVEATASPVPAPAGNLTVTRLYPDGGDLAAQLQGEALKAASLGQHMFVEFDATW
jgi:hypothetical protein